MSEAISTDPMDYFCEHGNERRYCLSVLCQLVNFVNNGFAAPPRAAGERNK